MRKEQQTKTMALAADASAYSSAAIAQTLDQVFAVTLAQIGQTAVEAAEQIAHMLDGTGLDLGAQELFQRQAHDIRSLARQTPGGEVKPLGQIG